MSFIKALLKKVFITCFVPAPEPEPEPMVFAYYNNYPANAYHNGLMAGLAAVQAIAAIQNKQIVKNINMDMRKINQYDMQYNPMYNSLDTSIGSMYSGSEVSDVLNQMQDLVNLERMFGMPSVPRKVI